MAGRGKHLVEGVTLALLPTVEAGEGVGARTDTRSRTLSMVCPGQWLILALPPRSQKTFRLKGLKKPSTDEPATLSLREGAWEQATLEQPFLGHAWGQLNPDQNKSLK